VHNDSFGEWDQLASLLTGGRTNLPLLLLDICFDFFSNAPLRKQDTVKTRLVTQVAVDGIKPYTGIVNCIETILKEEGIGALYRSLGPRLASVVPMIGIQFGVYEMIKKKMAGEAIFTIGYDAWPQYPAALGDFVSVTAQRTQAAALDFLRQLSLIETESL
jgi:hypothetical protein